MLKPVDIKGHRFQAVGRGFYKNDEVDEYMDQVVLSYETLFAENRELVRKLKLLANKIVEYREDEESIRKALLSAQRMSARLISEAKKEAEEIIHTAEFKAKNVDSIANAKINKMIDEVDGQIKATFEKARSDARAATVKAEKEAQAVIIDAKAKASEILEEASKTSEQRLINIQKEINSRQDALTRVKEETSRFKNEIIDRFEEQIKLISELPDISSDFLALQSSDLLDSVHKASASADIDNSSVKDDISIKMENMDQSEEFDDFLDFDFRSKIKIKDSKFEDDMVFEDVFSYTDPSFHESILDDNTDEETVTSTKDAFSANDFFNITNEEELKDEFDNFISDSEDDDTDNDIFDIDVDGASSDESFDFI